MINKKLALIDEHTSPLFRIMWVYNSDDRNRKHFGNNICAFHIGNGNIISVAHNLRTESRLLNSMDEELFQNEIFPSLNDAQKKLFLNYYQLDTIAGKRHATTADQNITNSIMETYRQINYDTRWITLIKKNICSPYLIIQFRDKDFYHDASMTKSFDESNHFAEPALNRHTFLIKLELQKAFYSNDIALYKIQDQSRSLIERIPFIEPDFSMLENDTTDFYCVQSSPGSYLGRLINRATIEGFVDNWSSFRDSFDGNYIMEGMRYLIKGYFRFGSSGAPYVYYHQEEGQFKVNAIQSEASPIQLSIKNNREGNFQYVNAIATPLKNIQQDLQQYL